MPPETPQKPQILLVEDDDQIAYLMQYILEHEGYVVHRAADVPTADTMIGQMQPPALVTLDIGLGKESGVDLILKIKDTPGWERVPIVMVTAQPKGKDVNWAVKTGAKGYIVKPFRPEELRDTVKRLTAPK